MVGWMSVHARSQNDKQNIQGMSTGEPITDLALAINEIKQLKDELTLRTSDICAYENTVSSHEAMISRLNAALERKNGYIENLETKLRKVREAAR